MTHKAPVGAYRAPGAPQATFAIESVVDDGRAEPAAHDRGRVAEPTLHVAPRESDAACDVARCRVRLLVLGLEGGVQQRL
ncbi:MAG TPA: molybdopterin cofactor-binding domain-containing protein [bacterium]|nr:molybdopterin cofactor-binding domain-containing protein [bacterium]